MIGPDNMVPPEMPVEKWPCIGPQDTMSWRDTSLQLYARQAELPAVSVCEVPVPELVFPLFFQL